MAFYKFDGEGKPLGRILRTGLDNLRDAIYKLKRIKDDMAQMTNTQITDSFGFADDVTSGNAAAELSADVGKLLDNGSISGLVDAYNQMLAQFG